MPKMTDEKVVQRDTILFGGYDPKHYARGGVRYFDHIDAQTLRELEYQGFLDPEDAQDFSPTAGDILYWMEQNPGFTAHGYAVSPERFDCRVAIEGVEFRGNVTLDNLIPFTEMFRHADDFDIRDNGLYCWYD